ncbi:MAG: 3-dehydroquinate synthase [Pseudomonadota bacterium]
MSTRMHTLHVELVSHHDDRSYPIVIGDQLLADAQLFEELLGDRPVVLVSNNVIAPLYMERVRQSLGEARKVTEVILPDGEAQKTLETLNRILTRALEDRHERRSVFVALGGGVVGDMTGFAAACFQRGVDFIQLPTTLLAQVDSSVGGKTGVNHAFGKNMIGAFHQPIAVLIDLTTLHTLPPREFAAGIAEVVKYGLIYDPSFFEWLLNNADRLLTRDESVLAEAIERSCAIKAEVVAADEREGGLRAILNFGHTFGHAIEKEQGYGAWLHGEAVASGMIIAARISAARGDLDWGCVAQLEQFLRRFDLPIEPPKEMTATRFLEAMAGDKKVDRGRIRYVLLAALGQAVLRDDITYPEIAAALGKTG